MGSRSFRLFGTKKDLENIFIEFQKNNSIKYYKCGKNDGNKIQDITEIDKFGLSISGSHLGNQYLVVNSNKIVNFDNHHIYQKLNESSVVVDIGGLYDENTVLPTTVSTIWYDNEDSKKIYNDLKKTVKRHCSKTVNGYMILENAYNQKEQLRFITISIQSPRDYDLKV